MKLPLGLFILFFAVLTAADLNIRGFPRSSLGAERTWEEKARAGIQAERIRQYLEQMAARPHLAGSPGSKAVADTIAGLLRSWGLDVRVEEFEVLLPTPTVRSLEMIEPHRTVAALKEPPVAGDKYSFENGQIPPYNAFSASGDVTAPLVYANYGLPEDYDYLRAQGVDVKGKIVIVRYGVTWRGMKPKLAHEHGAVGCIIYSDPRDDGYFAGDVFPRGPFRPPDSVQRGSVLDLSGSPGDPLTPGWAAEKGAHRLPLQEAKGLQKIPVLPISYADARPLLRAMRGQVAPEQWRGALPITYHLGPGTTKVRLHVDFDWSVRPIYDVIAEIRGSRYPDRWVIYGNHHDAWVNGASDPGSAASALLETARVLGSLSKQGWRPERTVRFAFWDGEEFGLMGSTEWTEKHAQEIARNAVAYLNSDASGWGRLQAGGSPILASFVAQAARDVIDPAGGHGLWHKDSHLIPLGSGSDYTPFLHHLGVASLTLGFSDPAARGCYHSAYDDIYWYEHFSDTNFAYGRALAQLNATALIRLADAPVLPFNAAGIAEAVSDSISEIDKLDRKHKISFAAVKFELDRLKRATASFDARYTRALPKLHDLSPERLAAVNDKLFRLERLLARSGLPGRDWYRNRLYAPAVDNGYNAVMLPGVREAADARHWDEANRQAAELAVILRNVTAQVRQAENILNVEQASWPGK
jgi:N-acetylated-alpha-linked acidic dipeptidase